MDNILVQHNVLLIESDAADARSVERALSSAGTPKFQLAWVTNLAAGAARLRRDDVAVVLLGLSLPDFRTLESVDVLLGTAPRVPVVVLSTAGQEDLAQQAVRAGAEEYLLKAHVDRHRLPEVLARVLEKSVAIEQVYLEKEWARVTLDSIADAVISTDLAGNVTYLNGVAETMTGWPLAQAAGRSLEHVLRIVDGGARHPAANPVKPAVPGDSPAGLGAHRILRRRDGLEYCIEDSSAPIRDRWQQVTGAVTVFRDVGTARSIALKMTHLAQHDLLTGLPNQMLLNDRLAAAIEAGGERPQPLAVLHLGLDHFRFINDGLGHAVGDRLLQSVGRRLAATVGDTGTVSRQGGDEFVLLLTEIQGAEAAAATANQALAAVALAHEINDHELHITASIGIALFPRDGRDAETVIRNAALAFDHAKRSGLSTYAFFGAEISERARCRQSLEAGLRNALARNEFVLHYQPVVNLETGAIETVEALLRWRKSASDLVQPEHFIHLAEASGLIVPIGRWVLREACRQVRMWQSEGIPPLRVSVNISSFQIRSKDFVEVVRTALEEHRLDPGCLAIEITESALMQDSPCTSNVLRTLLNMGVHLTLDNFGTGCSSLTYLRRAPFSAVKIARSFVGGVTTSPDDAAFVGAIIDMTRSRRQRAIAQGIETAEQLAFLQERHCDDGQGYLFSPPLEAGEFLNSLRTARDLMGTNAGQRGSLA